jgi:sulfoxide reductase heme-binding subunit YedZ
MRGSSREKKKSRNEPSRRTVGDIFVLYRKAHAKRWQMLHKAVYVIAILAVLHFFWMRAGKNTEVYVYAAILCSLLGWRLWCWYRTARLPTA